MLKNERKNGNERMKEEKNIRDNPARESEKRSGKLVGETESTRLWRCNSIRKDR
jgi:hypothetical protein